MIRIIAPGIDCNVANVDIGIIVVTAIMDHIYYEETNDVLYIQWCEDGAMVIELKKNKSEDIGFDVSGKWYCLPDAEDIVGNYIAKLLE